MSKRRLPIDNIDIHELLDEVGIEFTERGKNVSQGWIGVTCPFCDDHSNHLGINIQQKTYSCFKCGKTGNIISYLSQELNSFKRAMDYIEKAIPRELKNYYVDEDDNSHIERVYLPPDCVRGLDKPHQKYLLKRGFNPKALTEVFNLHHTSDFAGRWSNRIIFPVVKHHRLVTFTSVSIEDDPAERYLHERDDKSIIPIKNLLLGSELSGGYQIIAVEGLFDFLRFGRGATPLWGVKYTDKQVQLLSKFNMVKVVGDGDKDGWNFNRKLSATLAPFTETKYFDLEKGLDPDKLTKEEIQYIKRA